MATIVLTGGGTGGHIMPNLALVPELKKHFDRIIYIGGSGMEKRLVPEHGLDFYETAVVKFDRKNLLKNIKIPFIMRNAVAKATEILKNESVCAVFSKGGYASLPACYSAKALKIPVIVHESDMSLGLANKITAKFAVKTLGSFPETKGAEFVGHPIRAEIFNGNAGVARRNYRIDKNGKPNILIFGGSLGAQSINEVVYEAIPQLTKNYNVIHIAGKTLKPVGMRGYTQIEYAEDINNLYALADLLVIRGGAGSLAEASALGKKTLCIPLPKSSGSRGDQLQNAKSYEKRGFCNILLQENLTKDSLISEIEKLTKLPPQTGTKSGAVPLIVEEICKWTKI
ncbi:MAG: UDP-N-acetylglucosamine--N-acetylmuramyl-(pentapeptide) pyrophosphoryl-undecaprenol N-acetylglucosamine transferase [Firmicutes bacterium]|nr:UDP-N-acetylglucosamine--N-acetylmuramyl-(pentapeptide) pyrophosphoryl-undecaprenol N-acetylglucosamine transferase [Bacillota bacterium]